MFLSTTQVNRKLPIGGGRSAWLGVIAGLAVLSFSVNATHAQWTQWGGPNQDFKSASTGLAKEWPTEGPRKLWSRDLGEGYSAILVDGDRLYTMYRANNQEIVICLDAASGATKWEHKYDATPGEGHVKEFGEGPRATPLVYGDRLYTIGVTGVMHALDKKTGAEVWKHDLWKEYNGNFLNHGYSSSPIGYKDTVIALVGGKDNSIMAFHKDDGKIVWHQNSFENSYATPKIFKIGGRDQLITFMATEVVGVDPANGDLKWQFAHTNEWKQNIALPVLQDDILFISSADVGSRGLRLTPTEGKFEVAEAWSSKKVRFYHVSAIQLGDFVYGSSGERDPAFLTAVNVKTGAVAWRERGFSKANCLYADGRLIILDEDGTLGLATVTPEALTVHSKVPLLEKVAWTVPTLAGKTLYVRDKKKIMAVDLG